jgi:sphingosine kinase
MTEPLPKTSIDGYLRRVSSEIADKQFSHQHASPVVLLNGDALDIATGTGNLPETPDFSCHVAWTQSRVCWLTADKRSSFESFWTTSSAGLASTIWLNLELVFAVTLKHSIVTLHFLPVNILNGKARDAAKPSLKTRSMQASSTQDALLLKMNLEKHLFKSINAQHALSQNQRPRVLCLLNPFGGTGKAQQIYSSTVQPMLRLAGMDIELLETRYPLHATEMMRNLQGPLHELYHCVFTISGDGLFHEMINGILTREDWEESRLVPVGMVGAGSANALCKNVDAIHTESQVLAVIRAKTIELDIFACTQHPPHLSHPIIKYAHLELLWGLIADADIESEKHRWAGMQRVNVAVVVRMFNLRKYAAKLWWLTNDYDPSPEDAIHQNVHHYFDPNDPELKRITYQPPRSTKDMSKPGTPLARVGTASTNSLPSFTASSSMSGQVDITTGPAPGPKPLYSNLPPSHLDNPSSPWQSFSSDTFTMLSAMNMPWAAQDALFAPKARMDDGLLDLSFTNQTERSQLLGGITEAQNGKLSEKPWIRNLQCRAMVLWPEGSGRAMSNIKPDAYSVSVATSQSTRHAKRADKVGELRVGILDIDGEAMPELPIWIEVLPRVMRLSVPPWFQHGQWGGLQAKSR